MSNEITIIRGNKRDIADRFTAIVSTKLHYYDIYHEPQTYSDINNLHNASLHRYRNDYMFKSKVNSIVFELINSFN